MELTKNEIIQQFKIACNDIENIKRREMAVGYQYNRTTWELLRKEFGLIRIQHTSEQPKIVFFCLIAFAEKNNILTNGKPIEFELTPDEYNELEGLFYGEFVADNKYHKKWYVGNSNIRDTQNKPKWFELRKRLRNYIADIERKEHLFERI